MAFNLCNFTFFFFAKLCNFTSFLPGDVNSASKWLSFPYKFHLSSLIIGCLGEIYVFFLNPMLIFLL